MIPHHTGAWVRARAQSNGWRQHVAFPTLDQLPIQAAASLSQTLQQVRNLVIDSDGRARSNAIWVANRITDALAHMPHVGRHAGVLLTLTDYFGSRVQFTQLGQQVQQEFVFMSRDGGRQLLHVAQLGNIPIVIQSAIVQGVIQVSDPAIDAWITVDAPQRPLGKDGENFKHEPRAVRVILKALA